MADLDENLSKLERTRLRDDGIAFLLIQFVDIHGSAKVKLVPATTLKAVAETGAGFAGGAVWGMGQGPHSHDMFARPDLETYTPCPTSPELPGLQPIFMSTVSRTLFAHACSLNGCSPRPGERGYVFNAGIEPEFFLVVKNPDGTIRGWDPHGVDDLAKPCYDYKGISGALGFLRRSTRLSTAWAGASIRATTKTRITSTR